MVILWWSLGIAAGIALLGHIAIALWSKGPGWNTFWTKMEYVVLLLGGVGLITLAAGLDLDIRENALRFDLNRTRFVAINAAEDARLNEESARKNSEDEAADPNVAWFADASAGIKAGNTVMQGASDAIKAGLDDPFAEPSEPSVLLAQAERAFVDLRADLVARMTDVDASSTAKAVWVLARIEGLERHTAELEQGYAHAQTTDATWYVASVALAPILVAVALGISLCRVRAQLVAQVAT